MDLSVSLRKRSHSLIAWAAHSEEMETSAHLKWRTLAKDELCCQADFRFILSPDFDHLFPNSYVAFRGEKSSLP
jgi:hypothetical protein